MSLRLRDIVRFRGDRLFNGAVSLDWFLRNEHKRRLAAESFIFHGPKYHGVTQEEVGYSHGHQLQDTASFTRTVIRRCYGREDQPFTLAIAGYGTGKSHLALTLAVLLSDPQDDVAEHVLSGLEAADAAIGAEVRAILREEGQPCLVVTLNGMQSFDLTAEITRQVILQVRTRGGDIGPLNELRPRFSQAASLIRMSSNSVISELVDACDVENVEDVIAALDRQDESTYGVVHDFFAARGMPIRALGGESVRDVIEVVCREYCGEEGPFGRMLILFDEFGRYTEFATIRSQIAGSGVLQDLFEGVQANADRVCFVGFIQFELNAYVQRVAPEFKNDILRYVTRYQSAAGKAYLSINLETLTAHLLEKQKPDMLDSWFDGTASRQESRDIAENLHLWFPQSCNHRLWNDTEEFHTIIRKGCWPLSPYSTWFLFYLAAAGKHLQERSALALLGDVFLRYGDTLVPEDGSWSLAAVDLWSDELQQELIASEEGGQQGSITHSYSAVQTRHGSRLSQDLIRILRAVVLGAKMGLQANTRDEAIEALAKLAGLPRHVAREGVAELQDEYNVLEWDQGFKQFDILGDAVPRTQFLSFVRQRVASSYDEEGKAKLFASKAADWCDLLGDLECDFAEENSITTREWFYRGVTSNLELLVTHLRFAADRWSKAVAVDEPRGTVVYCYVEQSRDPEAVSTDIRRLLCSVAREVGVAALPILVVLLCDEEGRLGQALAELAVLEDSITEQDRARFGNLVEAHKERMRHVIRTQVEDMIKRRQYITGLKDELRSRRLSRVGTELFERIYKKPLPFPFDGFSTTRGNAADTCQQLTIELLRGALDYDTVIAMPVKSKNRAVRVLKEAWGAFTKTGAVSRRPNHPVVRGITEMWDRALQSDEQHFLMSDMLRQVCQPPYGANIASAGLLLGLFVGPRNEQIAIVRDGEQYAVSQWLQDDVFRRKFLDLTKLQEVELVVVGETSSEWENLLDEWGQAESYLERSECLSRAYELRERVPVPPALRYRFQHLEQLGQEAVAVLREMDEAQNKASAKIEQGYERNDVGKLGWGAADLCKLNERMTEEMPLWTEHQIEEMRPAIERARQTIIQIFPEWLARQSPDSDNPTSVGDFKHKMLRLVGANLKELRLDALFEKLEAHTMEVIRNAETVAEARQLVRDVHSWLVQHADACRIVRVAELRGLRDVGKDFSKKLQGMARRIVLPELSEARLQLTEFLEALKSAEDDVMKRASHVWKAKLRCNGDLEYLLKEIDELTRMFEGCELDLKDFRLMRRGLEIFQRGYRQLQDDTLTWSELESLAQKLEGDAKAILGEEDIPWPVGEVFANFIRVLSKSRKERGTAWIEALESEADAIDTMSTVEVNRLHKRASSPPAYLTDAQSKRLSRIVRKLEQRLSVLAVEWLLEKFRELPESSKKRFLQLASDMVGK